MGEIINAREVLENVEYLIEKGGKHKIAENYNFLSIFDWWKDYLSPTNLKDMRKFLKEAIKLGYTGYVCFKVGVTGCANGMWAYREETTDGYAPNGVEFLYKSFTPAYEYWDVTFSDDTRLSEMVGREFDEITTIRELETALFERECNGKRYRILFDKSFYTGGEHYQVREVQDNTYGYIYEIWVIPECDELEPERVQTIYRYDAVDVFIQNIIDANIEYDKNL